MSQWFRMYGEAINDPKVLKLSEVNRWRWVALLCVASINDGILPPVGDIALMLRLKIQEVTKLIALLVSAKLLDEIDGTFRPHNWNGRQYKSDVTDPTNAARQKRYRDRKRNAVTYVTDKRPETEAETEQISEAKASDADASVDDRTRLFREGLAAIARLTGKGPDACRSFVGKCLKAAEDNAVTVLGLIEDAERNRVVDPAGWIAARLKMGVGNGKSGSGIIQAADDLRRKIASFDGPPRGDQQLRSGESEAPVRLLPHR